MKTLLAAIFLITSLSVAACGGLIKPMPIHQAAYEGNFEAIQQHIKDGSDLNEKDQFGSTPLIIAATFGKTDVAIALIGAGADMNITNYDGATALHISTFFCRTEIVAALLEKGADKDIRNKAGSTAFESVAGPFESVKPYYDNIVKALGPLGLQLDYEQIKNRRPKVAEMLK